MIVRRLHTILEELFRDGGQNVTEPYRLVVVAAVIKNPWSDAGLLTDLSPEADRVAPELGSLLARRLLAALGTSVEAYGKAAIVGLAGEAEHGLALIRAVKFGDGLQTYAHATTPLPAVEERAPVGTTLDITLAPVTATSAPHRMLEVRIPDAPHAGEIIVALAAAGSRRPLA